MTLSVAQTEGQQHLDGMDRTTKFSFVGIKYESLKHGFQLGEEVEFRVRGRVVGAGKEEMADGRERDAVKVRVDSAEPISFDEPEGGGVTVHDDEGDGLFSDQDNG